MRRTDIGAARISSKPIPEPDMRLCNSWIIVRRATGEAVLETWSRAVAEAVNQNLYEVRTAHAHLVSLNRA